LIDVDEEEEDADTNEVGGAEDDWLSADLLRRKEYDVREVDAAAGILTLSFFFLEGGR